jgi:hypothetical protein
LSISEDKDEVADADAGSDDADAELDSKPAPTAAKWGMAGLLLVYAGLGSYSIALALGAGPAHPAGVTRSTATALGGSTARSSSDAAGTDTQAIAAGKSYAARSYAAKVAASAPAAAPPVEVLTAVSATAVGPLGASDGDHPQLAQYVLDPHSGTSWVTHWYASAHFGNLQDGTGLVLDMGRVVTIKQVQLSLAGSPGFWGADVEIRIGDTPTLADAKPAAVANDVGGWVSATLLHPATGRYVQIWFTKLPRDAWGTYQEHIYGITVHGSVPARPAKPAKPADLRTTDRHTTRHPGRTAHRGHPGVRTRGSAGHGGHSGGGFGGEVGHDSSGESGGHQGYRGHG